MRTLLRGFLLVALCLAFRTPDIFAINRAVVDSCDDPSVCNPDADCETPCYKYDAPEPQMTCGEAGGVSEGLCSGTCPDGVCNPNIGEDSNSCPDDCPCFPKESFGAVTSNFTEGHGPVANQLGLGSVRLDA